MLRHCTDKLLVAFSAVINSNVKLALHMQNVATFKCSH